MAEFVMKELARRAGRDDLNIASAALHDDEIGSDIHRGTRAKLTAEGIPFSPRAAWRMRASDADAYDWIVVMDGANLSDARRLVPSAGHGKVRRLLSFAGEERDIADPWYTGDFDATYADVLKGCAALLEVV
jgi:protein-tyrosine phosphatase